MRETEILSVNCPKKVFFRNKNLNFFFGIDFAIQIMSMREQITININH